MYFIGYHGTSETSALSILNEGVRRDRLPKNGQIGPGFYVARMKGKLPEWGAEQATAPARHRAERARLEARRKMSYFTWAISYLTGDTNNPIIDPDAVRTILKVYATQQLQGVKWNIMNQSNLEFVKASSYGKGGSGINPAEDCKWLQMVVPFGELKYLYVTRDNGLVEQPQNWLTKEGPDVTQDRRLVQQPQNRRAKESPF
jgi:hypothetical protein